MIDNKVGKLYEWLWETYSFEDGIPAYKILNTAKTDFPIFFGNIPQCERCKRYEKAAMNWFKKWFGSDCSAPNAKKEEKKKEREK